MLRAATGLKARDNINSGSAAFKAGNFAQAVDHFKTAVELDPTIPNIRIYLATAYLQQYIPGTETAENKKYAEEAMKELHETLKEDPKNLLATAVYRQPLLQDEGLHERRDLEPEGDRARS